MTLHTSLRISAGLAGERNVWTRAERIEALKKIGRWKDGDPVVGLPKVRTRFKTKAKPKAAKAETAATPAAGAAPAAAAPAAKPAEKGKK